MALQNINYSILDLAVINQEESVKQTFHNSLKIAQFAEALNYSRIWYAEHHNSENIASSATSLLIGYVAENTNNIRIGSGGIMLPNHSPLIVAEQFATLAHLYPNRIDLGLGRAPGTDQQTAQAIKSDFFKAAHSFASEIEKIQTYFSIENKNAKIRVSMAEGIDVPLYILGSSTDSAHLAAAKGLPYAFASHFASTHLYNALAIYKDEFQPSNALNKPYTMAGINVFIADTDEEAEKLFTSLVRMFIGILTGNPQPLQPATEMTNDLKEALAHPQIQQMLKFSFVGSKQTVKNKIEAFIEATDINELIMVSNIYNQEDKMKCVKYFAEIMEEINLKNK